MTPQRPNLFGVSPDTYPDIPNHHISTPEIHHERTQITHDLGTNRVETWVDGGENVECWVERQA